jgi:hypothetical protein
MITPKRGTTANVLGQPLAFGALRVDAMPKGGSWVLTTA